MSKSKAPKDIRQRRETPRKEAPAPITTPERGWLKLGLEIFGVVCAIVGFVGVILSVLPKLSVGVSGSLRPLDPMATVFYVSNDGLVSVYDVKVSCVVRDLSGTNGAGYHNLRFQTDAAPMHRLEPGHKLTADCSRPFNAEAATKAEMGLMVEYKPLPVWWKKSTIFPMKAEKTASGEWVWSNLPED